MSASLHVHERSDRFRPPTTARMGNTRPFLRSRLLSLVNFDLTLPLTSKDYLLGEAILRRAVQWAGVTSGFTGADPLAHALE